MLRKKVAGFRYRAQCHIALECSAAERGRHEQPKENYYAHTVRHGRGHDIRDVQAEVVRQRRRVHRPDQKTRVAVVIG